MHTAKASALQKLSSK